MRLGIWHLLAASVLAAATGSATARAQMGPPPGVRCEQAINAAARAHRVPGDLMGAIGLVETGRPDPVNRSWRPWPWTINAEGRGLFFESKAEAIAAVRTLQAAGVRSIDVGCMQINLMHHPNAFATLEEAFDPSRNALYAGHFLGELFQRSGNWIVAAGWYHSTTAERAADYVKRVTAVLPAGRQSLATARSAVLSANWRGAAPVVNREGMLLPSVRLNTSGLLPVRHVERPLRREKPGARLAG